MKNHGLNLELEKQHQKREDWIFGAGSLPCIAQIPANQRDLYLPKGEVQRGADDTLDCASRAPINILETKLNWLLKNKKLPAKHERFLQDNYLTDNGVELSDAFVAINSNTTRRGNSLIAPLDAIHSAGVIPKKMLPLENWMTWDDYHNPARITDSMRKLGQKFLNLFAINYERVLEQDFSLVLETDMIDVGGYAWPSPVDGEYPKTSSTPNHAFVIYKKPEFFAFDNYIDKTDGDFVKKLARDYDLIDFGYRLIISVINTRKISFFRLLLSYLTKWRM